MTVALPPTSLLVATFPSMMCKEAVQQPYQDAANVASSSRAVYDPTPSYGNHSASAVQPTCQWEAPASQMGPSEPSMASSSSNTNISIPAVPSQKQQATWSPKRRRSSGPPKNSTDALAKWFAELVR